MLSDTIWSFQWRLPAFLIAGTKNVHVLKPTHSVLSFPSFFKQTSL